MIRYQGAQVGHNETLLALDFSQSLLNSVLNLAKA